MSEEEHERQFLGVWIEKEIYLSKKLTLTEKVLFTEIRYLDNEKGCFASNAYLANFLGRSESVVSKGISKLIKLGMIKKESFDGRQRVLKVTKQPIKNLLGCLVKKESLPSKLGNHNNIMEYSKSNKDSSNDESIGTFCAKERQPLCKPSSKPKKTLGKEVTLISYEEASDDSKRIIRHWNNIKNSRTHGLSTKIVSRACFLLEKRLLRKYSYDDIIHTIDEYHEILARSPNGFKKVGIDEFFTLGKFQKMKLKQSNKSTESWFERLIEENSYLDFLPNCDSPEVLAKIKEKYSMKVLGDSKNRFTFKQEMDFATATRKLLAFMKRKRFEKYVPEADWLFYVTHLFRALGQQWGYKEINTGNLASDYTYNEVYTKYITEFGRELGDTGPKEQYTFKVARDY